MPNHPDIPDLTALQRNTAHNRTHLSKVFLLWAPALLILLPLNVWAACSFSTSLLLEGYAILFKGVMKGLAVAIMCAGIILPPTSLAFWIWERLQDEVVF